MAWGRKHFNQLNVVIETMNKESEMKSTKYQLLKSDFDSAIQELKLYREMIEQLKQEKKEAYFEGYKQGRFDEKMDTLNK